MSSDETRVAETHHPERLGPDAPPAAPLNIRWTLLLLAAAVFLVRLAISITLGWNTTDEAWNLRVVHRFLSGETLYRDVYFGVTPLPVYIAAIACKLFGVQALVLKALSSAAFAGMFVATWHVLRLAGRTVNPWPIAMLLALVPISPYTAALYNDLSPLSILLLTITVLRWQKQQTTGRAVWIGMMLGICFVAKQNTGLYAVPAVMLAVLLATDTTLSRRCLQLSLAALIAAAVVGAFLLPIALAGGWPDMMIQCFSNKRAYLQHAGVDFLDGFRILGASAMNFPDGRAITTFYWSLIFPLVLVTPLILAVALVRRPDRRVITVIPFLVALAANMYPRLEVGHVARAFPAILIALVLAAPAFPRIAVRSASITGLAIAAAGLAVLLVLIPIRLASSQYIFSQLPRTRGILMHVNEHARLRYLAAMVAQQPQPTFILSTEAGALYLVSRTGNPTPYDYPLINAFPPGTQAKTIESIRTGRIRSVVFQTYYPPSLLPRELTQTIINECTPVEHVGGYGFYAAPGATTRPATQP